MRDCIITSNSFLDIHKLLSVCLLFSSFIQANTKDSKEKDETAKFDSKFSTKLDLERRKEALQEVSGELNSLVNTELFSKTITEYDTKFSQLLLNLLAKIIDEMRNGLGEVGKIGNVLYRYQLFTNNS